MQFEGEFWGKRLSSKSRGWGNKVEIQLGGNPGQSKCAEMSFDPLSHDFSTLSDRLYQLNVAKKLLKSYSNFFLTQLLKFFFFICKCNYQRVRTTKTFDKFLLGQKEQILELIIELCGHHVRRFVSC